MLTLPEVKPYLGIKSQISDSDIEGFLDAAEAATERRIGPLVARAQTSTVRGSGSCSLALPVTPLISVTSITGQSGTTVTPDRVSAGRAAVVYALTSFSESYYTVVYQVGHAASAPALAANIRQLVALELKYQWEVMRGQVQRGPDNTRLRADDLARDVMGSNFA